MISCVLCSEEIPEAWPHMWYAHRIPRPVPKKRTYQRKNISVHRVRKDIAHQEILAVLPGTAGEVARALEISKDRADSIINGMVARREVDRVRGVAPTGHPAWIYSVAP